MNSSTVHVRNGVALLLVVLVCTAATAVDRRLVDAAKHRDWEAVKTLIAHGADVNVGQPDGATALHWAAHWNELEAARALLGAGAGVNATNDFGVTPLALACTNANVQLVQALLQAGADANSSRPTGESVLMTCSRTGNAEAVSALIQHGATVNAFEHDHHQTALMWAAAENHPDVVAKLLTAGADLNARTQVRQGLRVAGYRQALPESVGFSAILFAARAGARESLEVLLAHGGNVNDASSDGEGVLQTVMSTGHWNLVSYLLDQGADPNADGPGYTPLHWASGSWEALLSGVVGSESYRWMAARGPGKLALVQTLLAYGADPNRRVKKMPPVFGNFGSSFKLAGASAFVLAGTSADVGVMRALLEYGADPLTTAADGTTALMAAAGFEQTLGISSITAAEALEAVKVALAQGIDVNAKNKEGETALHGAAYFGADPVVQFLVDHGASVNARNRLGLTPRTVAQGYGGGGGILINGSTAALLGKFGGVGDVDLAPTPVAEIRTPCPHLVVDFALNNPGYGKVYVTTTQKTQFVGGSCADIKKGTPLRIKGIRETDADTSWDGSVVASVIEIGSTKVTDGR